MFEKAITALRTAACRRKVSDPSCYYPSTTIAGAGIMLIGNRAITRMAMVKVWPPLLAEKALVARCQKVHVAKGELEIGGAR
jgi:hypothetical protein